LSTKLNNFVNAVAYTGVLECTIIYFQCLDIEVTANNLEDLLVCDDLFLDYFNAFLTLPVRNAMFILSAILIENETFNISAIIISKP
jgi:hypothetical protein